MPPQRRSPPVHSVEKASLITAPTLELLALQLCLRNHPTPANQCPPLAALWRTPLAAGPPLAAFLASHAPQIPLAQFEQAYRFTSSRAFLIDQFRKYAIVPFADDFNHSNDQNVEVRAEYWVCPVCGCEGECAHDLDDGAVASGVGGSKAEQGMVEVVVCRAIAQGEEIFNSYGQLSNRQLLLQCVPLSRPDSRAKTDLLPGTGSRWTGTSITVSTSCPRSSTTLCPLVRSKFSSSSGELSVATPSITWLRR